jgi:hypothetical protein
MEIPPEDIKYFEDMGVARVRLVYAASGFGSPPMIFASQWLAEIDEAQRKVDEARQKWTLIAAWIAAIGTIVGIVVMFALWDHPRR